MIELNNISKIYNDYGNKVMALADANLNIAQGEFVAIVGASGSGKSTLLNIIGAMDRATNGTYYYKGQDICKYKEKEMARLRNESFGFVVQDFALIERYTVEKNVMLPLYYSNRFKNKKQRVAKVLEEVGLIGKKNSLAAHLSGGQRQRVAIARALVNNADVLLCDEPTGALDKETGNEIMNVFEKLNKAGKTVIIVTHDDSVSSRCKRVIEISDGKIIADK